MPSLQEMLTVYPVLLADGATGTNFFEMGLVAGDAPEFWNVDDPAKVIGLHQGFIDAGADIILTNTFGGNRDRLKLHNAQDRVYELNKAGAELAREVADKAGRPVVVAGSIGPLGELFEPLGALTDESAFEAFAEQARGLKDGGADVCWIETMSATEEIRAAALGAIEAGMPYTATASFDTAGMTMMGVAPPSLGSIFADLPEQPVAIGSNCGVGASDLLVSVLGVSQGAPDHAIIAKANCGIPQVHGDHVHYSGTPELMADYARLAADAGVRIIGGCCGTSNDHLAAMRAALDKHTPGGRPDRAVIEAMLGPLASPPSEGRTRERASSRRRRA
jgi:5-methyltetrahydrofolate--homocysteine methyltransferase